MEPTRERAWETLTRYTKSDSLLRHALAVEASTAAYARKFGEDEELWRVAALLHDFDYEMHPTLDKHPQDGAPILREEGYPEEVVETVLSHAEHLGLPRDTPLKKALFACDELSGFVHACALVRPTGLEGLEPKSVKKKLKQPSFAAGVSREDVYEGAEELGIDLDQHPQDGAPILREEGYPDEVVDAVLSHAEHLSIPRDTQLKKTLFACDELSGFVHAVALVRPGPLRARARAGHQLEHGLDVADARDVRERHRLFGEQAGGEDRQGTVLVPGGADAALERISTLDDESLRGRHDGHAGLG